MVEIAYASRCAISVERRIYSVLRAHQKIASSARSAVPQAIGFGSICRTFRRIALDSLFQSKTVDTLHAGMQQPIESKLLHYRQDSSGTVYILDMVMRIRGHLAEHRGDTRQAVDIVDSEVGSSLVGNGQQMEHSVGRAAHGDIERHGVEHRLACGDVAREYRVIAMAIVGFGILHNLTGSTPEELAAVGMCGENCAVAGKSKADGFVE